MNLYDCWNTFNTIFSPFFINLGSIYIATKIEILGLFLPENQNSFTLNVTIYIAFFTAIQVFIGKEIDSQRVEVIADLALKKDDMYNLNQKIELSRDEFRNVFLRVKIDGNGRRLDSNSIRIVFPIGVTANCNIKGVFNESNENNIEENIIVIPLEKFSGNDISCFPIHLLPSTQSMESVKSVACSLKKNACFVNFKSNKLQVVVH